MESNKYKSAKVPANNGHLYFRLRLKKLSEYRIKTLGLACIKKSFPKNNGLSKKKIEFNKKQKV